MKTLIKVGILALGLAISACASNGMSDGSLTTAGDAKLDKKGTLVLTGSGFAPNAEIAILFKTADGVESDIGYALDPAPVIDGDGNFATTWSYGRFVKKKLVAAGDYTLTVTNDDFDPLANATVTFVE